MPKPPVQIGNVYESKDSRESGRRVQVEMPVPGEPDRWICVRVYEGRTGDRKFEAKLSTKNLQSRWKLISAPASDTLQSLLRGLERMVPAQIEPFALKVLREAWVEAGCPGLRR